MEMLTLADGSQIEAEKVGWTVTDPEGRIVQWGPPLEIHMSLSEWLELTESNNDGSN